MARPHQGGPPRRRGAGGIVGAVVLALAALVSAPADVRPAVAHEVAHRPVAPETALVVVRLVADGEDAGAVVPVMVTRRPMPWRDPALRYDPARHRPPNATRGDGVRAQRLEIVSESPDGRRRAVVAADLTPPPGDGGDVVDVWTYGAATLRAPCFGPGTRLRVVRTQPGPPATVAEAEAPR